jgi:hypothetical protein
MIVRIVMIVMILMAGEILRNGLSRRGTTPALKLV